MKPKRKEKPKDEVKGTTVTIIDFKCWWVPKSNHSKENERKNKKGEE